MQYSVIVVQSLSRVQLFVILWTVVCQASLSFTISQILFKLMSIESVMPSNHLILCHPLLLPPSIFSSIRVFSSESALCIRGLSIGVTASASILPMNIQDWFPLGLTVLISFRIDWFGLLAVTVDSQESSPAPQFKSINSLVLSHLYGQTHIHTRLLEKQ